MDSLDSHGFINESVVKIFDGHAPSFADSFNGLHHPYLIEFLDLISYCPLPLHSCFSIVTHALSQQLLNTLCQNPHSHSSHCISTDQLSGSLCRVHHSSSEPDKVEDIHAKLLESRVVWDLLERGQGCLP